MEREYQEGHVLRIRSVHTQRRPCHTETMQSTSCVYTSQSVAQLLKLNLDTSKLFRNHSLAVLVSTIEPALCESPLASKQSGEMKWGDHMKVGK